MNPLLGQILNNRYRIDAAIGRGGMAEVYKVWDSERATYLALKLLREDLAQDHIFIRRFEREARNLAKLQHPNIVHFYGLEQDDLLAFILMDFVDGNSLRAEIFRNRGKSLPVEHIRQITRQIFSALHYAHNQGVIHCDLKPGNILIEKNFRVLLSDFGIARTTDAATATMAGIGSPAYMAPEQIRGQNPTPQTDIYSLGIVLYEMLTGGERPFTGEHATTGSTSERVRWEQLNLKPPSPRKWNPEISPELEAVVLKCLEKDPAKRYPSALDLLNALELALSQPVEKEPKPIGSAVDPEVLEAAQSQEPPSVQPETGGKEPGAEPQRKLPKWVWGAVGMVILVGLIFGLGQLGGGEMEVALATKTSSPSATTLMEQPQGPTATNTMIPTSLPTDTITNPVDGAVFSYIPAGEFLMGSNGGYPAEQPIHTVYVDAFWIQIYEVTNLEFLQFLKIYGNQTGPDDETWLKENGKNLYIYNDGGEWFVNEGYKNHPVVQVNWYGANAYCENLGGRLPTEAEWEKAARGGLESANYPWGDQNSVCTPGAENGAQSDKCSGGLQPVGSFAPNGYGLYDIAGNLWEWVSDWYGENYYSVSPYENPLGPDSGERRVCRGGAWDARYLGVATRNFCGPSAHADYLGFRCVVDVEP